MITVRTFVVLVLVSICLISGGCSGAKEVVKTLGSLAEVRAEIIKKFGDEGVDVKLNSVAGLSAISITFINSPLNEKGKEHQERRAMETAEIVKAHYADIKSINEIVVAFMKAKTTFFVFHQSALVAYYGFDNEANFLPAFGSNRYRGSAEPAAHYSATTKQTSVQNRFQLEGVAGHGLTMDAQFKVLGDTSKVTPKAPATMSFDFASFAEKQQFPQLTKVAFLSDSGTIYETEEQFSTSRSNDGLVSEFLYLTVPYPKFRQMVSAKELTISLGERKFKLTDEQFQAFQKMDQYVKN